MAKRKGNHASDKAQYAAYQSTGRKETNRSAKLKRHMKRHPNDAQAQKAVGKPAPAKNSAKVKGNFPAPKDSLRDPITGQPMADVAYAGWDSPDYDPIPPKKKARKNAK